MTAVPTILRGDCVALMRQMAAEGVTVQAIVTDPPYHLTSTVDRFGKPDAAPAQFGTDGVYARVSRGFMGQEWDGGDTAFRVETWQAAYALLPPGGHLIAFGGTRTYHRMVCAIEDAGFEIRDQIAWVYGTGFPKSLDVSKQLDLQEKNAWLNVAKAVDKISVADIMGAWITRSNAATPAAITFRKSQTEAGPAMLESGSAPASVLLSANPANSLASAIIVELTSSAAPHMHAATANFAQWLAADSTTALSALVTIAESQFASRDAMQDTTASSAPWLASASLAASTSHMEVAVEALKIWLGSERCSKPAATDALCAALTDALKHITLSQSETFRSLDTKSQTDCASAINVITTASTAESLIWFTAATLKNKALDKMAGAERVVIGANPNHRAVSGVGYEGIYAGGNTESATITAPATDAARQWQGWGSALKPSHEPVVLARKPLDGTVAETVLAHGTGAINVDGCRVEAPGENTGRPGTISKGGILNVQAGGCVRQSETHALGRWPANLVHDGSPEVDAAFAAFGESKSPSKPVRQGGGVCYDVGGQYGQREGFGVGYGDTGTASRFFYSAKAGRLDRVTQCLGCGQRSFGAPSCACPEGTKRRSHPTTKPLDLMRWLVRLVTPPGGVVLDPFMGSGTTLAAALTEGFGAIGCDLEAAHVGDAEFRCANLPDDRREPKPKPRTVARAARAAKVPAGGNQLLLGFADYLKARAG